MINGVDGIGSGRDVNVDIIKKVGIENLGWKWETPEKEDFDDM